MVTQSGATVTVAISDPLTELATVDKYGVQAILDATELTNATYTGTGAQEWTFVGPAASFGDDIVVDGTAVAAEITLGAQTYEFTATTKTGSTDTSLVLENVVFISNDPGAADVGPTAFAAGSVYGIRVSAFKAMRLTDRNGPSLEVGELTSNEVSANRQETSIRSGFQQVTGQIGFELSYLSQDELIELATADPFADLTAAAGNAGNGSATYTASTKTFGALTAQNANDVGQYFLCYFDTSFSFIGLLETTTSVKVVQHLQGEEPEGNLSAGSVTSLDVVGMEISMVRKAPMRYSTIVKDYPEISAAQAFGGCTVNNLSMSVQPGSLATGTADILGIEAKRMQGQGETAGRFNYGEDGDFRNDVEGNVGSLANTTAYSPFSSCVAIDNVGTGVVSGFDFTINNNRETIPLLCSAFADNVYEGVANVSGTMTLLFEDEGEYNKFANETESSVIITLSGGAADGSDAMFFHFPRVRYTQPSFEVPANGPVVLTLNFRSLEADYGQANDPVKTSCVIGRA
tara:strand:+ start:3992 stop:5545 length:1554 start_codon:yes stop_codon:yes gene_type:complete